MFPGVIVNWAFRSVCTQFREEMEEGGTLHVVCHLLSGIPSRSHGAVLVFGPYVKANGAEMELAAIVIIINIIFTISIPTVPVSGLCLLLDCIQVGLGHSLALFTGFHDVCLEFSFGSPCCESYAFKTVEVVLTAGPFTDGAVQSFGTPNFIQFVQEFGAS